MPVLPDVTIMGTVTHYPSGVATVQNIFISAPASANWLLWCTLGDAAGVQQDDDQVFTIRNSDGALHVMFSDGTMYIGTALFVEDL